MNRICIIHINKTMFQLPMRLHGAVPVPDDAAGGARARLLVPARGLWAQPRRLPRHQQQAQAAPGRLAPQRGPRLCTWHPLLLSCFYFLLNCIVSNIYLNVWIWNILEVLQNKENSFKLFQNIVKDVNQKCTYRKSLRLTDDGERLQVTRLANTGSWTQ